MHLGLESLLQFYRAHSQEESLVLGTIIATEGSTYRKTGAMMLIAADGSHRGLISGGCLESDLAQHARQVFQTQKPQLVSYDLSADNDMIWGLGIGCEGVVHLLLQPLVQNDGFGFLSELDQLLSSRRSGWFSLVTKSTDLGVPVASLTLCPDDQLADPNSKAQIPIDTIPTDSGQRFYRQTVKTPAGELELLQLRIVPPPALLICGAGVDALPLARLATELGWYCQIVDHRAGFADPSRFPATCVVRQLQADALSREINLAQFDAAVIMSHNLEHDRSYLQALVKPGDSTFGGQYIGLLGPQTRRNKLLGEVDIEVENSPFIHGPAGLDIGAELPESIALSIIAEIHALLNSRSGGALTADSSGAATKPPGVEN